MRDFIKFIILLMTLLMVSCDKPNHFSNQRKFDKSEIQAGLPDGTLVAEPVGINWWRGTYNGDSILIHILKTDTKVNTQIIFLPSRCGQ